MEADLHAGSLLAAGLLQPLSENSCRGHRLSTVALYPGIGFVNSNTATGLRVCLYDDGRGSRSTGKERDAESGLDYFGARYYGSALGRFTSPDDGSDQHPEDPQSWNLYGYVRNNPLKNTDPSGLDCVTTSNQTLSGVSVSIARGGSADTCSGTFVDGTVDEKSLSYNGTSLGYSFSNDTASGSGTIAFSKYSDDDWAPGSSNMQGAAQIGGSQSLVNEFMKQAAIGAAGALAGRAIGAGIDAFLAARAARAAAAAVDIANLSNKIVRQMASRGWTAQEIVDTVQGGKAYSVVNNATGGAATEYINPANGKFVVVDNATKQVLQVSSPGFSPNHLTP
jgi:RHS repeat-associated protein